MPFSGGTAGTHDDSMHQGSAKRDVAEGLAGLDVSGHVLAPGYRFTAARGAAEQITIRERTSDERAFRFIRIGADDYEARVNVGGVEKVVQHEGMKDVASGIVGLDANILLSPALLPLCMEEYSNHLGAVDNYTQTGVSGSGSATGDATNHEMDLSSGTGSGNYAYFGVKLGLSPGGKPLVSNIKLQNLGLGSGGDRAAVLGFTTSWANYMAGHSAFFKIDSVGGCVASSYNGGREETPVSVIANGDVLTVVVMPAKVMFFINGVLEATHTTRVPTGALKIGAIAIASSMFVSTALTISIDYLGMRRYL